MSPLLWAGSQPMGMPFNPAAMPIATAGGRFSGTGGSLPQAFPRPAPRVQHDTNYHTAPESRPEAMPMLTPATAGVLLEALQQQHCATSSTGSGHAVAVVSLLSGGQGGQGGYPAQPSHEQGGAGMGCSDQKRVMGSMNPAAEGEGEEAHSQLASQVLQPDMEMADVCCTQVPMPRALYL